MYKLTLLLFIDNRPFFNTSASLILFKKMISSMKTALDFETILQRSLQ